MSIPFEIDGLLNLDTKPMIQGINSARKSLDKLVGTDSKKLDGMLVKALENLNKFEVTSKRTFDNPKEIKKAIAAYGELVDSLKSVSILMGSADFTGLKGNWVSGIDEAKKQINDFTAKLAKAGPEFQKSLNKFQSKGKIKLESKDLVKALENGENLGRLLTGLKTSNHSFKVDTEDIVKKTEEIERIKNEAGELSKELAQLTKISKDTSLPVETRKAAEGQFAVKKAEKLDPLNRNIKSLEEERDALKKNQRIYESNLKIIQKIEQQFQALSQLSKINIGTVFGKDIAKEFGMTVANLQQAKELLEVLETRKDFEIDLNTKEAQESIETLRNAVGGYKESLDSIDESGQTLSSTNKKIDSMKESMVNFFSLTNGWRFFQKAVRNAVEVVKELDAAMTEIAVVSDYTLDQVWEMRSVYSKAATEMGAKTIDLINATKLYVQQGLSLEEAQKIGMETVKMARIANLNGADATNLMTAAVRGFRMELTEANRVNDVYSNLAAKSAADTEEIAIAMSKTASIAANAGSEFESMSAFLTQIIETTRESPETAGTAMKTIIARFQELKKPLSEIGEVDGEVVDANAIEKALRSAGIAARDSKGQFRDFDDIIYELSAKWDTLDVMTQRYIATMAAGSRQQSRFIALVADNKRLMELTRYAVDSAGAAQTQFDKTLESLEAKMNRLANATSMFFTTLANSEVIKFAIDLMTVLVETINNLTGALGGGLLSSIAGIATMAVVFKALQAVISVFFKGIAKMSGYIGKDTGKEYGDGIIEGLKGKKNAVTKAGEDAAKNLSKGFQKELKKSGQGDMTLEQLLGSSSPKSKALVKKYGRELSEGFIKEAEKTLGEKSGRLGYDVFEGLFNGIESANSELAGSGVLNSETVRNLTEAFKEQGMELQLGVGTLGEYKESLVSFGKVTTVVGGSLLAISAGLTMIASSLEGKGLDKEAENLRNIAKWLSVVGAGLISLQKILSGVKTLNTALAAKGGIIGALGGPVGVGIAIALTAAVTALGVALSKIKKANFEKSITGQLEKLRTHQKEYEDALTQTTDRIKVMKDEMDKLGEKTSKLDDLKEGTLEWRNALVEANDTALEMIKNIPGLEFEVKDGRIIINEEDYKKKLDEQESKETRLKTVVVVNDSTIRAKELEKEREDVFKKGEKELNEFYNNHLIAKASYGEITYEDAVLSAMTNEMRAEYDNLSTEIENMIVKANKDLVDLSVSGSKKVGSGYATDSAVNILKKSFDMDAEKEKIIKESERTDEEWRKDYAKHEDLEVDGKKLYKKNEDGTRGERVRKSLKDIKDYVAEMELSENVEVEIIEIAKEIEDQIGMVRNEQGEGLAQELEKILSGDADTILKHLEKGIVGFERRGIGKDSELGKALEDVLETRGEEIWETFKLVEKDIFSKMGLERSRLVGEQFKGMKVGEGQKYREALSNLIREFGDLMNEEDLNLIATADWSDLEQATDILFRLQTLNLPIKDIEEFWRAATSGAGLFVGNTSEAIDTLEMFRQRYTSAMEAIERIQKGAGTKEDVQLIASYGLDTSGFEMGLEGWSDPVGISRNYLNAIQDSLKKAGELAQESVRSQLEKDQKTFSDNGAYLEFDKIVGTDGEVKEKFVSDMERIGIAIKDGFVEDLSMAKTAYTEFIDGLKNSDEINRLLENLGSLTPTGAMRTGIEGGLEKGDIVEFRNQLMTVNKLSSQTAENVSVLNGLMNKGLSEIMDTYDDWSKLIDKTNGKFEASTLEDAVALASLKESAIKMLNVSGDLSNAFWDNAENARLLKEAAEGSADALARLQKIAMLDQAMQLEFGVDYHGTDAQLAELYNYLYNYDLPTLEVGATLDDQPFIDALNHLIKNAGMTQESVSKLFKSLGFDAELVTEKKEFRTTMPIDGHTVLGLKEYVTTVEVPSLKILTSAGSGGGGISSTNQSKGASNKNKGKSGKDKKDESWKNSYDWLYNLVQKTNKALRDRNRIESDYDRLLRDRKNTLKSLYKNTAENYAILQKEKKLLEEQKEKRLKEVDRTQSQNKGLQKYGSYNKKLGYVTINWDAINKVTNKDKGQDISNYISSLEKIQDQLIEIDDNLLGIDDRIAELKDRGKEEYLSFSQTVYDAVTSAYDKVLEGAESIHESITNSNNRIISNLQDSIAETRKIRENQEKEDDIADMEQRLAFLRRDTSGANQLEIMQLEEQLSQARQDYTDQLIDDKIDELQKQNEKAEEQRQLQIDIARAQLDYAKENGTFWSDWETGQWVENSAFWSKTADGIGSVDEAIKTGISVTTGHVIPGSNLFNLLAKAGDFEAMGSIQQMEWLNQLNEDAAQSALWAVHSDKIDNTIFKGIATGLNKTKEVIDKKVNSTNAKINALESKITTGSGAKQATGSGATSTSSSAKTSSSNKTSTSTSADKNLVKDIQFNLSLIGYLPGDGIDGSAGPKTRAAIKAFEKDKGRPETGIANETLRDLLKQEVIDRRNVGNIGTKKYKKGGFADYTGLAWLDGTKSDPEAVLNAQDTKNFVNLLDVMEGIRQGSGGSITGGSNYFDIRIIVDELGSDYDVNELAREVKRQIYQEAQYRNVQELSR